MVPSRLIVPVIEPKDIMRRQHTQTPLSPTSYAPAHSSVTTPTVFRDPRRPSPCAHPRFHIGEPSHIQRHSGQRQVICSKSNNRSMIHCYSALKAGGIAELPIPGFTSVSHRTSNIICSNSNNESMICCCSALKTGAIADLPVPGFTLMSHHTSNITPDTLQIQQGNMIHCYSAIKAVDIRDS